MTDRLSQQKAAGRSGEGATLLLWRRGRRGDTCRVGRTGLKDRAGPSGWREWQARRRDGGDVAGTGQTAGPYAVSRQLVCNPRLRVNPWRTPTQAGPSCQLPDHESHVALSTAVLLPKVGVIVVGPPARTEAPRVWDSAQAGPPEAVDEY